MDENVRTGIDVSAATSAVLKDVSTMITSDTALSFNGARLSVDKLVQTCFKKKYADKLKNSLLEIVLAHCLLAEKLSPGSFVSTALEISKQFFHSTQTKLPEYSVCGLRATRDDLKNIALQDLTEDELCYAAFSELIELCSVATKISIEKAVSTEASVELFTGHTFNTPPSLPVSLKLAKPKIIVIDGYVESVSEIHHLLEDAAESKVPLLLFVRGMSDDVLNTLSVNNARGSIIVVPFVVKFDLETVNVLNDIAVVSGCDVVSSHKGQLISAICLHTIPNVLSVAITPQKVTITNPVTADGVKHHVQALKQKKFEMNNDDIGVIYDKRIASLVSNKLVIRLPNDAKFVKRSQLLDVAIRKMRSVIEHGVLADRKSLAINEFAVSFYANKCLRSLRSIGAAVYA